MGEPNPGVTDGGKQPGVTDGGDVTNPGDAENQKPAGGEAEAGEGGGTSTSTPPDTLEDALKLIEANDKERSELLKKVEEGTTKFTDLSSKVGKQSDQIAVLRKLQDLQSKDPKGLIDYIAKEAGLSVEHKGGGAAPDLSNIFEEEDPAKLGAALQHSSEVAYNRLKSEFGPQLETMFHNQLKEQYPDFDDLAEDRTLLSAKLLSKDMTHLELLHLAAQGANMAAALEDAKTMGVEAYKKELAAKAQGQYPEGGEHPALDLSKHNENDPAYLKKVLTELGKIT